MYNNFTKIWNKIMQSQTKNKSKKENKTNKNGMYNNYTKINK